MAEPAADQRDAGIVTEPRRVAGQGGPRGRFRLLLAVAVPPAVLVAVVGAALVGSPAQRVAVIPSATSIPASGKPPADPVARVDFPTRALGLPVVDVESAHALVDGASATVLAVRGYLTMAPPLPGCEEAGRIDVSWTAFAKEQGFAASPAPFCERRGTLRSPAAADRRGVIHRLDITMTFGAVLPDAVTASHGLPVPVVLVGTVSGAADGCGNVDRCDQRFEADRLVWANGLWRAPATSVEPALHGVGPRLASRIRDRLASEATAPSEPLLLETLIDAETLSRVDPAAASSIGPNDGPHRRIWYRRSLDTVSGPDASVRWVAIDDDAGTLLGSGIREASNGARDRTWLSSPPTSSTRSSIA